MNIHGAKVKSTAMSCEMYKSDYPEYHQFIFYRLRTFLII